MSRTGENIYKRKDGRWEVRYIKCYLNKKAKYGYVYSTSYMETKKKLSIARASTQLEKSSNSFNSPKEFSFWVDSWLSRYSEWSLQSAIRSFLKLQSASEQPLILQDILCCRHNH